MANYFQNMIPEFHFLILAVLLINVCLEIQFTQGRQLKQHHDFGSVQILQSTEPHQVHARNLEQQSAGSQKHEKMIFPSESREFSRGSKEFEPEATGNSPGIGHSHVGEKDNTGTIKMQEFSTTSVAADGHVKEPAGHSPGVGHSVGNLKKVPN
ncbi:uncharacterized protein LOC110012473 [Sesamum indicum]|uniref:Uncharacterized protein LOC110012473 n=1 Tax=Sesamum indicum TaxID=4182 RepID=A0A8M8V7C6_SESIN|nr:uncharacterized protein LOC110012473 [Sesamum indicum]